jgi:hypothetical protein
MFLIMLVVVAAVVVAALLMIRNNYFICLSRRSRVVKLVLNSFEACRTALCTSKLIYVHVTVVGPLCIFIGIIRSLQVL